MMKKLLSIMLAIVMCTSFSISVFAEGSNADDENQGTRASFVSVTIKDTDKNRYNVQAGSLAAGTSAETWTYFKNTYVYDGTAATQTAIYNGTKTLGATGSVTLSGGGTNSFGSITNQVSNTLETTYNPYGNYLYNVTLVIGQHEFSYNGAYYAISTSSPY